MYYHGAEYTPEEIRILRERQPVIAINRYCRRKSGMIRKVFEGMMFGALVAVAVVWVALWASTAFGQVAGVNGPSTGTTFPSNSNPVASASTGTTGAVTASIPALVGQFGYICGFQVSTLEGVTAGTIAITVGPLFGGTTFTYQVALPASAATTFGQTFRPCIPGSASNTAITVTSPANANATAVDVNAWGYQIPAN